MNVLLLLFLLLLVPLVLLLAWFALSSCLGDNVRAHFAGVSINPRHATYGQHYARTMGSGAGQAGWEQIEMEDMMDPPQDWEEEEDDYPRHTSLRHFETRG